MRSIKIFHILVIGIILTLYAANCLAQSAPSGDVVMVLPFENKAEPGEPYRPEYNWVGESFADSLTELLNKPGLRVVSSAERELAYRHLHLPESVIPSRATAITLARQAKASMLVIGNYSVRLAPDETKSQGGIPGKDNSQLRAFVLGSVRIIKVNEGLWLGTELDGQWASRSFFFGGPLTTLQSIHGDTAYQILLKQFGQALAYSQNMLKDEATKIPQRAFEAYVKGIQLAESDPKRENYLKNALRFYADDNGGAIYPQAAFELGRFHMFEAKLKDVSKWKDATEYFSKIEKKDPNYAEAAFYAGLGYAKLGDLSRALAALVPLSSDVPLIGIYNNAGAVAVEASRREKKDDERNQLLAQGTSFLARAAESSSDDPMVRFNYALALFLGGKYAESAEQLKPLIPANPQDGSAYFIYAKSLEKIGQTGTAAGADDLARRYLPNYAKLQTEWQKSQTVSAVSFRMRDVLNGDDLYNLIRNQAIASDTKLDSGGTQSLAKARELYQAGRDDEAMVELRRALTVEPTSAEIYLLSGRINLRRGEQEQAIAALKTAIFWDTNSIDAHILLGRIFLERGDRGEATKYATRAMTIDSNNQEAIALQRQVTMGKN